MRTGGRVKKEIDTKLLEELWVSGTPYAQLIKVFGLGEDTLRVWVKELGLSTRKIKGGRPVPKKELPPPVDLEELREAYLSGCTYKVMCERFGRKEDALRDLLKEIGVLVPWWGNTRTPRAEVVETRARSNCGKKRSLETKMKMSLSNTSDIPMYSAIHERLASTRGKATLYSCVDCGGCARDWSYTEDDPNELKDSKGLRFSRDLERYVPRCVSCHKRYDFEKRVSRR